MNWHIGTGRNRTKGSQDTEVCSMHNMLTIMSKSKEYKNYVPLRGREEDGEEEKQHLVGSENKKRRKQMHYMMQQ